MADIPIIIVILASVVFGYCIGELFHFVCEKIREFLYKRENKCSICGCDCRNHKSIYFVKNKAICVDCYERRVNNG